MAWWWLTYATAFLGNPPPLHKTTSCLDSFFNESRQTVGVGVSVFEVFIPTIGCAAPSCVHFGSSNQRIDRFALQRLYMYAPGSRRGCLGNVSKGRVLAMDLAKVVLDRCKAFSRECFCDDFDIGTCVRCVDQMAGQLALHIDVKTPPRKALRILRHYVFKQLSFTYADSEDLQNLLLNKVLSNRRGNCLSLSILILGLGYRLGLPLRGVAVRGHMFVRYDTGARSVNMDVSREGKSLREAYYVRQFGVSRSSSFYLRSLHPVHVLGIFLSNLGNACAQHGQMKDAVTLLKESASINPDHPESLNNLGNALRLSGMIDEAIQAYQRAVTLDATYSRAHYHLGIAFKGKGEFEEAIGEFRSALEHDPSFVFARINLATTFSAAGLHGSAITELNNIIQEDKNCGEARIALAGVYERLGEWDDALAEYKEALRVDPNDSLLRDKVTAIQNQMMSIDGDNRPSCPQTDL